MHHLTITGSVFTSNEAGESGGCIYSFEENYYTSVLRSVFTNNTAISEGGVVYLKEYNDHCVIKDCVFDNNTVLEGDGGVIMVKEKCNHFYLSRSIFSNNGAIGGNGGAVVLKSDCLDMTIDNTIFTNNFAGANGGACVLYSQLEEVILSKNEFIDNVAGSNGGGIFMFIAMDDVTITDSVFTGNIAYSGSASTFDLADNVAMGGGAMFIDVGNAYVQITRCLVDNNTAPYASGGGFFINSNNRHISIVDVNQTLNFAYRGGGSLYIGSANWNVLIQNSAIFNNTARLIGGGACMILAYNRVTFSNSSIFANQANVGGGLLFFVNNLSVKILDCLIYSNHAILRGGGVNFGILHQAVRILGTKFVDNWAGDGGAISIEEQSIVVIGNSEFRENIAFPRNSADISTTGVSEAFGGAVYTASNDLYVYSSYFEKNKADEGGAMYMIGNHLIIHESVFRRNEATTSGGVMKLTGCNDVLISSCNMTNNSNIALEIDYSVAVSLQNSVISQSAGTNGAGVAVLGSEGVNISNSHFSNNIASGYGGAVYCFESEAVVVQHSTFLSNSASNAGAVFVDESNQITLLSNIVESNNANVRDGGGVSLLKTKDAVIRTNIFRDNYAPLGGGGGVYWEFDGGEMEEPSFLLSNTFSGNSALYGDNYATDPVIIDLLRNSSSGGSSSDGSGPGGNSYSISKFEESSRRRTQEGSVVISFEMTVFGQNVEFPLRLLDKYDQLVANQDGVVQADVDSLSSQCGDESPYITGKTMGPVNGGIASLDFAIACDPNGQTKVIFETDIESVPLLEVEVNFRGCLRGEYYSDNSCIVCGAGTYSLIDFTNNTSVTSCSTCPDHATCHGDVIIVDSGYWRLSNDVVAVFTCPLDGSCAGGANTGTDMCNVGYTGVMCGVCDANYYYPSLKAACEMCSTGGIQIGLIILVSVIGFALLGIAICLFGGKISKEFYKQIGLSYFTNKWRTNKLTFTERKKKFLHAEDSSRKYQNKLKQLITLFQILTAFPSILSTTFPNIYYQLTSAFNIINLGAILTDLGLVCSFDELDYISTVVGATVLPIVFSLLLFIIQKIHCYSVFNQYSVLFRDIANAPGRVRVLKSTYQYLWLFFTYLILPGVSTVLFGMLKPCTNVDPDGVEDGNQLYLEADLSIQCHGSRYNFGVVWAAVGCVIYPLGVPCVYFYLLNNSKNLIQSRANIDTKNLDRTGLQELENVGMQLSSIKFLFQEYQPKFWYFEIIETFRKLFLTSVLSVISPGSTKQLVFGNLFVVICLIFYVCMGPFDDLELTVTSAICQLQIWFILFLGILIKENVHISSTFIEISVGFAILFILVYESFVCIIEFCPLPKPMQEFFDKLLISKSYPSPNGGGGSSKTRVSRGGQVRDMNIKQLLEASVSQLSRDLKSGEMVNSIGDKLSVKNLKIKETAIASNIAIVSRLQQLLQNHKDIITDRVRYLEDFCEQDNEDADSTGSVDKKVKIEKGFVINSMSYSEHDHNYFDELDPEEEDMELEDAGDSEIGVSMVVYNDIDPSDNFDEESYESETDEADHVL